MTPEDKIINVLKLIDVSRRLSASDRYCYIDPSSNELKRLTYIELKSILEKLESENILEVLKTPYDVWPDIGKENEPKVYTIKVHDDFDAYYDQLYESSRFGIKNLTHQNHYIVFGVAQEIRQELNIKKGSKVKIDATAPTPTILKGVTQKSISLHDIKQLKIKALNFLQEVSAIESFQLSGYKNTEKTITITVTRRKFDESFLQLILSSPEHKSSKLTTKLATNKKDLPKPGISDGTVIDPDSDKESTGISNAATRENKVRFDAKASKLTYCGKSCYIPDETLEYYICKLVFKNRRLAAKEDDILEYTAKSQDSPRAVYDAHVRVNKRARQELDIDKLLTYKAAKVRIATKYQ